MARRVLRPVFVAESAGLLAALRVVSRLFRMTSRRAIFISYSRGAVSLPALHDIRQRYARPPQDSEDPGVCAGAGAAIATVNQASKRIRDLRFNYLLIFGSFCSVWTTALRCIPPEYPPAGRAQPSRLQCKRIGTTPTDSREASIRASLQQAAAEQERG
jgi:hypothetical protein